MTNNVVSLTLNKYRVRTDFIHGDRDKSNLYNIQLPCYEFSIFCLSNSLFEKRDTPLLLPNGVQNNRTEYKQ